jgi:hypothetical protein
MALSLPCTRAASYITKVGIPYCKNDSTTCGSIDGANGVHRRSPRTTLPGLLLELNVNNVANDRPAIINGISGETVYTYSSLRAALRRVANYLRTEVKLTHGTFVGILANNSVRATLIR